MLWVNSYWGRLDYDQLLKLRQMDPGRAEIYKKECRENYQKRRIGDSVAEAKAEYEENISKDAERKPIYIDRFRTSILSIPGIENSEEFKELYEQVSKEKDTLDVLDEQLKAVTSPNPDVFQEGMDEMWVDEPQFVTPTEVEESKAIDDRLEEKEEVTEDTVEVVPEMETTEEAVEGEVAETVTVDLKDLQKQYEERFGKPVVPRFKNDADWIKSKLSA